MFDSSLRRFKDRLGAPLALRLRRVSPLTISLLALLVGLLAAFAAYRQAYLWALGLWILNRALDGLDGLIARLHDTQSDFGGYADILTDFVIYAALPIGLVAGSPSNERFLTLSVLLASFYVNAASWMYLAALLEKRAARSPDPSIRPIGQSGQAQTSIVMPAGLIGGFETILAYGIFLLFPAHIVPLFSIFAALVFLTIVQRLLWAWKNLNT
ncbi:MAG: CDP-alcohol phosphatidyltransferase family protein [Anaerolineales bacterium]